MISYPLYLWHWPLLAFADMGNAYTESGSLSSGMRIALVLLSFLLAWITFIFVERPIRTAPAGISAPIALGSAMSLIMVMSVFVTYNSGLPMRSADNNPRSRFLQHHYRLHDDMTSFYRSECDFFDWRRGTTKISIADSCTLPGQTGTWFLWGDSHAEALSYGLKSIIPEGVLLDQVATSGCPPSMSAVRYTTPGNACNTSNSFARSRIALLRPDTLILAQRWDREPTNWDEIAAFARNNGVRRVLLIGPAPEWLPSLPQVVAAHYFDNEIEHIEYGLNAQIFKTDLLIRERYDNGQDLEYVSLVKQLCDVRGCRATVAGKWPYNLIAMDYGHLTPMGSVFVAQNVLAAHLVEPRD